MFKARESKLLFLFLLLGLFVGAWFANDQPFLSASWVQKFFSAQAAVSVLSTLIFRIISAESRHQTKEQTKNIENLAKELSEIIPRKFQESAKHFEKQFMKIEHEANVRYNRQMMSQEEEHSEFWHYQQDFGREISLNICVKHENQQSGESLQDDYELKVLGTYENVEGGFPKIFYIVQILSADARGGHKPIFKVDEILGCTYSKNPRISRKCIQFDKTSYEFHISGRMGTVTFNDDMLAKDASIEMRLVDRIRAD